MVLDLASANPAPGNKQRPSRLLPRVLCLLALHAAAVTAHEHHDEAAASPENALKPIDSILWLHIYVQVLVWGFAFPLGMVFGLTRSRWHVPVQLTSTVLTLGGVWLGHAHGGRAFSHSKHGSFAEWLFWIILAQAGLGVYLKLHIHEGKKARKIVLAVHGILGRLYPVIGYVQMLLGVIVALGYCAGGNLGQCLAHHIMGSSFMGYGIIILIMSMHGAPWLEKRGISQEFLDSTVIMTWGIINTFTEHNFLETSSGWSHKDMQHTSLGVLFWTGGALGMYLGRNRKRNIWPALVIALTGFAMSGHEQATMLSTHVHTIFGYTLMLAGLCRIIEICFVLKETHNPPVDPVDNNRNEAVVDPVNISSGPGTAKPKDIAAFQHTTPFLLVAGGLQFMSATEEEIAVVAGIGMDHVTYIIILFCISFVIYLWANVLISVYHTSGKNAPPASLSDTPSFWRRLVSGSTSRDGLNGNAEPKESVLYGRLPESAGLANEENVEMDQRRGNGSALPNGHHGRQAVFAADAEDDGADSYWQEDENEHGRRSQRI